MVTQNGQRLADFLRRHQPDQILLPAVRIRDVGAFDSLKSARCITLNKENLLHFFYGKPSYKLSKKTSIATRILGDAAVCFVFDLRSLPPIHRLFALDTGAFRGKRYDNFLPNGVVMADFELPAEQISLRQLVAAFFGSNRNYYDGVSKENLKIPALDRASEVYANIIKSSVIEDLDERACTGEIQLSNPVYLSSAKLITIIIPGQLYDDPEVKEFVDNDLRIKPVIYRFKRAKPEERTEVIYEKLGDFLQTEGFFENP